MKKLATFVTVVLAAVLVAPAVHAQTAAGFTGKWEGTFKRQQPNGTESAPQPIVLNLAQKGKLLTGTAGPADQQFPLAKGAVAAGKATFEVQQPNGPLFKFTLTIVKGRLAGEMSAYAPDGSLGGHAKVDAGKAAAGAVKK